MLNHYNILILTRNVAHQAAHFKKKMYWLDNTVLLSLSRFVYNAFIALGTKVSS